MTPRARAVKVAKLKRLIRRDAEVISTALSFKIPSRSCGFLARPSCLLRCSLEGSRTALLLLGSLDVELI